MKGLFPKRMTERSHHATSVFSGKIEVVPIDLGLDSHDHLMDPEHLLHIAMTTQ